MGKIPKSAFGHGKITTTRAMAAINNMGMYRRTNIKAPRKHLTMPHRSNPPLQQHTIL
jgi:hypothetical protein